MLCGTAELLADAEKLREPGGFRECIAARQQHGACTRECLLEEMPAGVHVLPHKRPVTIERRLFQKPVTATSNTWTRTNNTSAKAARKCSVRADWRPPSRS